MRTGQLFKKIPHHFITSGITRFLHPRKVACCGPDKRIRHSFASAASKPDSLPRKPALPATPWQVSCASRKAASQLTAKRNSMLWPTGDATKQQEKYNPTCTGQKPIAISSPLCTKARKLSGVCCWTWLAPQQQPPANTPTWWMARSKLTAFHKYLTKCSMAAAKKAMPCPQTRPPQGEQKAKPRYGYYVYFALRSGSDFRPATWWPVANCWFLFTLARTVSKALYQPSLKPTPTCKERKKLWVSSRGEILAETMPGDSKKAKTARCVKRELVEAARQGPTIIGRPFAAQTTCRQPMHNLLARRKCLLQRWYTWRKHVKHFFKSNKWSAAHPLGALQLVASGQSLPNSQKYSSKEKISKIISQPIEEINTFLDHKSLPAGQVRCCINKRKAQWPLNELPERGFE